MVQYVNTCIKSSYTEILQLTVSHTALGVCEWACVGASVSVVSLHGAGGDVGRVRDRCWASGVMSCSRSAVQMTKGGGGRRGRSCEKRSS